MVCWIALVSYDIVCVLRMSLPTLYSLEGRVTSRLNLGDNRKVITDYRNHRIIRILTGLVVSSGYLPGVLREALSRVMPWGRSPCGLPWVSRVVPPTESYAQDSVWVWVLISLV